jgi:hypothetical protein
MQSEAEDMMAARREILDLLRQQMDALNSPFGLTDEKLRECYDRQARVQELREKLQDEPIAMATVMPGRVAVTSFDPAS